MSSWLVQMVAVAITKTMWNWVRGKREVCEEAMREVLGAGRGEACRQARLRYR
jgi:hypothetical protein